MFGEKPPIIRIFAPFKYAADVAKAQGPKFHPSLARVEHVKDGQDTFVSVGNQRYELINTDGLHVSGLVSNTHILSEAEIKGKVIILTGDGLNISPEVLTPA